MSIRLVPADSYIEYIEKKVNIIMEFIKKNKDFLPLMYKVLSLSDISEMVKNPEILEDIFEDISIDNQNLERKKNEFKEFKNIIIDTFKNELTNKEFRDKIRGRIFERIIEYMFEETHKNDLKIKKVNYEKGCYIEIDGEKVVIQGTNTVGSKKKCVNKQTVDIAALREDEGEFYEIKIGPYRFEEVIIKLLLEIKNRLISKEINSKIGCISIARREMLINATMEKLSEDTKSFINHIEFYGQADLLKYM